MASLSRKYFASLSLSAESSINFTLLVVALLLLQYSSGFSHFLEGLGRFRSIPHTILFMIVVIACLQLQRPLAYLNRVQSNLLLIGPAFVIWALAALWAYTEGQTLGVLSVDAFAVVSIVSGLVFVLGILTKKDWLCFVGLAILIIVIGEAFIRNNPFDQIFILGRPLWNIRATGLRLMNGGWIYKFNDASSPAYFPFLFLPYLPFTFLGLDLRWANILGVLGILLILFWTIRHSTNAIHRLLIAVVFLSPMFMQSVLTTQVIFYWLYLTIFILAINVNHTNWQRLAFLLAFVSRQLFWPLLIPRLILWQREASNLASADHKVRFSIDAFVRWFESRWGLIKPSIAEMLVLGVVVAIILVAPSAFFWSTFVEPSSDGLPSALHSSYPQPSEQMALTPLLPYATSPVLVLATQAIVALLACFFLWRSNYIFERPAHSYILIYFIFLSINFVMFNYYWIDVVIMLLALTLTTQPASQEALIESPV